MRKFFGFVGGIFVLLILALGILFFISNEKLPEGAGGSEAEQLADKMMASVNKKAWDAIPFIKWTFKGVHDFVWDKKQHICWVKWDANEVIVDLNAVTGVAKVDGKLVQGEQGQKLVKEAWDHFNNDSFWLNAIVKAKDPGTERTVVDLGEGKKGLKVQYTSGGTTPGDSYLWILDENYRPTAYKMWVKIIPVGGMEFSWEDYVELDGGAMIATLHKSPVLTIDIGNYKAGKSLEEIGEQGDLFSALSLSK